MAICDRCNRNIEAGGGYAMFSEACIRTFSTGGKIFSAGRSWDERVYSGVTGSIGALLFCETCANALFSEETFANARHTELDVEPNFSLDKQKQMLEQMIDLSIAIGAKRRGLSAARAKEEARNIAQLWWKDEEAAKQKLQAQIPKDFIDIFPEFCIVWTSLTDSLSDIEQLTPNFLITLGSYLGMKNLNDVQALDAKMRKNGFFLLGLYNIPQAEVPSDTYDDVNLPGLHVPGAKYRHLPILMEGSFEHKGFMRYCFYFRVDYMRASSALPQSPVQQPSVTPTKESDAPAKKKKAWQFWK